MKKKPIWGFLISILILSESAAQNGNGLSSSLEIFTLATKSRTVVLQEDTHFEAPNWSTDSQYLLINEGGKLFRVYLEDGKKVMLNTGEAENCNNDHGISADGKFLAISNNDPKNDTNKGGSRIYVLPINGGIPKLITEDSPSYWHGWSPDGKWLIYVASRNDEYDLYRISVNGGKEERLTSLPGLQDGPEYSPDGQYIYFNSAHTGVMEIWRMDVDGSNLRRFTHDSYSNWFPHPSPDGNFLVYLSYLEDQGEAHPPMKEVALRLLDLKKGTIETLCTFTGGQGSINVPSWSPDSAQFAFVSYEED